MPKSWMGSRYTGYSCTSSRLRKIACAVTGPGVTTCRFVKMSPRLASMTNPVACAVVFHSNRQHAGVRYRVEHDGTSYRVRHRRQARTHLDESARRDAGTGDRTGDLPQSRGGAAVSRVSRPHPRLRHLSLRPGETQIHPTGRT